jgi:hypothetical protein
MNRRSVVVACAGAALAALLAGCASQLAGLAPVGGDAMTGVRTATVDVLMSQHLGILEVPVCTEVTDAVSCVGSLTDGRVVLVDADISATPHQMTVTVGGEAIYDGGVQDVLDASARGEAIPTGARPPTGAVG